MCRKGQSALQAADKSPTAVQQQQEDRHAAVDCAIADFIPWTFDSFVEHPL